jgi:hypothetical protein
MRVRSGYERVQRTCESDERRQKVAILIRPLRGFRIRQQQIRYQTGLASASASSRHSS